MRELFSRFVGPIMEKYWVPDVRHSATSRARLLVRWQASTFVAVTAWRTKEIKEYEHIRKEYQQKFSDRMGA